jgi:hypothetical protein
MKLEIRKALDAQRSQEVVLETLKPSQMNRLQRSIVSDRVPAVGKDSTVRVSKFLANTLKSLELYLQDNVHAGEHWKVSISLTIFELPLTNSIVSREIIELAFPILVGHL